MKKSLPNTVEELDSKLEVIKARKSELLLQLAVVKAEAAFISARIDWAVRP